MAVRRKYTDVASNANASFKTKYSLKNAAQLDKKDQTAYVIPLDMANGFVSIPSHTVRTINENDGFKGQYASKIRCHKYDPNTGEVVDPNPLCCRLAAQERNRWKETNDASKRAITTWSDRNIIPVLVLTSCDDSRPTLKKLSIQKPVSFSYIEMADMTYKDEFVKKIQKVLTTEGRIDSDTSEEESQLMVCEYLQNSVIMVSNEDPGKKKVPYIRSYNAIPVTNPVMAETSGERGLITLLVQLLSGKIPPERYNDLFAKYPLLQTINNQVTDFLGIFDAEVDTLVTEWEDSELETYYNKFVESQNQYAMYKDVNAQQQAAVQQQADQVSFAQPVQQPAAQTPYVQPQAVYQQPTVATYPQQAYVQSQQPVYQQPAAQPVVEDWTSPVASTQPVMSAAPQMGVATAVATPVQTATEANYDYSTAGLDEVGEPATDLGIDIDDFASLDADDNAFS